MNNTGLLFPLLILLLFIPILLSGRRQKRQMQQMRQLQSSLTDGDVVVTTSGLRGTVVDSSYEDTIDLEIAPGVVTTWVRAAVREKVNPPVEEGADSAAVDAPAHRDETRGATDRVDAAKPADTGTPADTAKPAATAKPADTASPSQTGTEASTSDPSAGRGGS